MVQRTIILFKLIKPIFIFILLIIYFYLIASPNITKYFEGGVMTIDGTPNSSYYPPSPAVTFCASRSDSGFELLKIAYFYLMNY